MIFSEIPAGADFYFGGKNAFVYNYNEHRHEEKYVPFKWRKTNLNGLSIQTQNNLSVPFDHPRPATGSNKTIRSHGHRLFFLTSLYKYLNCADESWKTVEQGDIQPRVGVGNDYSRGFLSKFNDNELKYLQPFNMKVKVPTGYTKQYGQEVEKSVLVGIPSLEQVGENGYDGTFGVNCRVYTWLSDADTMIKQLRANWINRYVGDYADMVAPIIRIKDDAPVDRDENGNFVIRVPEVGFDGDIDAFLGFEAAA